MSILLSSENKWQKDFDFLSWYVRNLRDDQPEEIKSGLIKFNFFYCSLHR